MQRETRRNIRTLVNLIHIAVQLVFAYTIAMLLDFGEIDEMMIALQNINSIVVLVGLMIGIFAINGSVLSILNNHQSSYRSHSSSGRE